MMNESKKKVSIVSVNFNQPGVTEEMLASIRVTNTYSNIEIIIVDNGSKLNPVPEWQQRYPDVSFIRSEINTGFAGGNNIGLRQATGDYYFLVNNDTEFTPLLIDRLVEVLDMHPEVGMVSPKLRYFQQPDMLQYAGYTPMNYYTARNHCIGQFEKDKGQYDAVTGPVAFAHGAAMLVRKEAVDKADLMYENYFLYYEELDWCERIKRAGYTVWVNMQALIYHKESVSVGQKSALKEYFMNRNRILFIRRNAGLYQRWIFYFYFVLFVVPRNILTYIREGQTEFIKQLFRAIGWNCTHAVDSAETGWTFK
jgi:GT2 family glycosyltransferase